MWYIGCPLWLQELKPGLYSLAFGAATAAPVGAAYAAPQQGEWPQHRSATACSRQGHQHSGSQQQSASPAECIDRRCRSVGILKEHPWQDALVAAICAGRTSLLPTPSAACPVRNDPSAVSGQLSDGFEAAVTTVLNALEEAVRIRCQCIDAPVGQADGSAHASLRAESVGTTLVSRPRCTMSSTALKRRLRNRYRGRTLLSCVALCSGYANRGSTICEFRV